MEAKEWKHVATTPATITPKILTICQKIDPRTQPVFISVTPAEKAVAGHCYENCEQAAQTGDEIVRGWIIWDCPGLYVYAEHHSVLKRG